MSREEKVSKRIQLLDEIVRCAAPALQWDKDKSDAWLPGLHDALTALKKAEDEDTRETLPTDLDKALAFIEELSKQPYLDRYAARFEAFLK